jgi:hypothetical protein
MESQVEAAERKKAMSFSSIVIACDPSAAQSIANNAAHPSSSKNGSPRLTPLGVFTHFYKQALAKPLL